MTKEDMVKEAVEEAKAKAEQAAREQAQESEDLEEEAVGTEEAYAQTEDDAAEESEALSEEEAGDEGQDEEKKGRKLFGKKNKKDKKDEKIEELTDRLTRQMAEFDNFRKRTDKEKSQMYEVGAKDIINKILPVVDNFERGLAAVPEEEKKNPILEGMEKVYRSEERRVGKECG